MSTRVVFPESFAADSASGNQRRRLRLHELEHGFHCSIVGTCLSPGTARQIIRRAKLTFDADAQDYRLHSVLVSEAAKPGIVSRLITKVLDDSFAGALRRVGATAGTQDLAALWDQFCEKGEIAAAYWAFLTHAHVPPDLRVRIFGEVHMLSHFMGGHNRAHAKALWLAERRAEQLAERLARSRRQAQDTQAERDRRIGELEAELAHTREELRGGWHGWWASVAVARHRAGPIPGGWSGACSRRAHGCGRPSARTSGCSASSMSWPRMRAGARRGVAGPELLPSPAHGPERCLLYVGGHCSLVPHLRRHAETRRLELLHHDGGEEHSLHVLEGLSGGPRRCSARSTA